MDVYADYTESLVGTNRLEVLKAAAVFAFILYTFFIPFFQNVQMILSGLFLEVAL